MSGKLVYLQHRKKLTGRMLFVTGVPRSGTTILGKIIASLAGVEYDYEPWFLAQLPVLESQKLIDSRIAGQLLDHYFCEHFHEQLIGRNANMRTTDDSCVLNSLTSSELKRRWTRLFSRDDSRRDAARRSALMAAKMVNLQPFTAFFKKSFPNAKWVHIVRHPFDVAASIKEKGWYEDKALRADEALAPRRIVTVKGRKRYLPWWVSAADEALFLSLNSFDRGMLNWLSMMRLWEIGKRTLGRNLLEVRYESLLSNPAESAGRLAVFSGCPMTPASQKMIRSVRAAVPHKQYGGTNIKLLKQVAEAAKKYGYEII